MRPSSPRIRNVGILPSKTGQLLALRTKAELNAPFKPTKAYVIEIPTKLAKKTLEVANEVVKNYDLHHLRRFVKPENLPSYLKDIFSTSTTSSNTNHKVEIATPKEQVEDGDRSLTEQAQQQALSTGTKEATLYFLICSESQLPSGCALESFVGLDQIKHGDLKSGFRTILVPILPPSSVDQARRWSEDYWPTVYKKSNPFGPHPSLVYHAESELHDSAERWMELAERAGMEVSVAAIGEPIGAVIVDRTQEQGPSVVAVAGDARWHGVEEQSGNRSGNVLAHAVMRAIGMVANRRRMLLEQALDADVDSGASKFHPLTPTEAGAYSRGSLPAGGYLCFGLEIYVTHEPCAMCSMAILHSRFGRIVFGERLPLTGGIAVDPIKTGSHRVAMAEPPNSAEQFRCACVVYGRPRNQSLHLAGAPAGSIGRGQKNVFSKPGIRDYIEIP